MKPQGMRKLHPQALKAEDVTVGMEVRYHPIIGEEHDGKIYTVRSIGKIPSSPKEDVVWLNERSGCVALSAISGVLKI